MREIKKGKESEREGEGALWRFVVRAGRHTPWAPPVKQPMKGGTETHAES